MFKNMNFYLNRETPIWCLQYLVLSFGGNFATDDMDLPEGHKITHRVMDRPLAKTEKNIEYVQP